MFSVVWDLIKTYIFFNILHMHIFERMVVCMTKYTRVYRFKSSVISFTNRQHFKSNKERMMISTTILFIRNFFNFLLTFL